MEEPREVELPAYHVVKLRYEGPPPPDERFFAHWRRFNNWAAERGLESAVEGVWAIGYAPPGRPAADIIEYDACIPVGEGFEPEGLADLEVGDVPGGPYVLCAGDVTELPLLLRAAKRHAMSRGLAIERGWIERYLNPAGESAGQPVQAGYRVHD